MSRSRLNLISLEDRTTPVTLPSGFGLSTFATGLTQPTAMIQAPDGRLLVTQQTGALRVIDAGGNLLGTPALQLAVDSSGERGLLGVAIDPNFAANGYVYLYYTVPQTGAAPPPLHTGVTPPHNHVSRYTLAGNTIDPASEVGLLDLDPLSSATNHNGGALHFGTDGKLYVAVGENGNSANAQTLANRLGKILRINPDGSIPADNPTTFSGVSGSTSGLNQAIYAVGFRNPFTFGVNPQTGQIFVNDVGQNTTEEVDVLAAGANYGWPTTEGDFDPAAFPAFTRPIVTYPHAANSTDGGFAIIGGAFYTPATSTFPASYAGDYFYGDLVNGWVRSYDVATGTATLFASGIAGLSLVDLDAAADGSLLLLNRGDGGTGTGQVLKIQSTAPPVVPPPPTSPPPPPVGVIANGLTPTIRVVNQNALNDPIDLSKLPLSPGLSGGVRVAEGNLSTYQNVIAVGTGPGQPSQVVLVDLAGRLLASTTPFEASFTGGVFVAMGDLDGNGKDEIIVTPDQGGGPRVRVYRDGDLTNVMADFFGIDDAAFRGGARVAAGDVNGDGTADLVVAAGFEGGPRVAGFEGKSVGTGNPVKLFNDFFAFEPTLRNGVYVTVFGGDIVVGGGPGGGPRVTAFSGSDLVQSNTLTPVANFFAGDATNRNGVRVGVTKSYNGFPDALLVGPADGVPAKVSLYNSLPTTGTPTADVTLTPFGDDFTGGVFVG